MNYEIRVYAMESSVCVDNDTFQEKFSTLPAPRRNVLQSIEEDWEGGNEGERPKIIHLLDLCLPLPIRTPRDLGCIPSYPVKRK